MFKQFLVCAFVLTFFVSGTQVHSMNYMQCAPIIEELYDGLYPAIPRQEQYEVGQGSAGRVAHAYGETIYSSVEAMLADIPLTKDDVFYDLGSGLGKVVMQVYLATPVKKAIGVELSPTRYMQAVTALDRFIAKGYAQEGREIGFRHEDMFTTDISDATLIYVCSTCFSDRLLMALAQRFQEWPHPLTVISLRPIPTLEDMLVKKYTLPMTWAARVDVHVYAINT